MAIYKIFFGNQRAEIVRAYQYLTRALSYFARLKPSNVGLFTNISNDYYFVPESKASLFVTIASDYVRSAVSEGLFPGISADYFFKAKSQATACFQGTSGDYYFVLEPLTTILVTNRNDNYFSLNRG